MDFKIYLEELKGLGLDKAEESAEKLVELVFKMAGDFVKSTSTPFDDVAFAALEASLKSSLLEYVDKIDGKEG